MTETSNIYILDEPQFRHYWPKIEEGLVAQPELWEKWTTLNGMEEDVREGRLQMWVAGPQDGPITVVFATRTVQTWAGKVLQVVFMYGDGAMRLIECIDMTLDRYAQFWDCSRIEFTGRKAWEPVAKKLGWEFMGITMTRPTRVIGKGN